MHVQRKSVLLRTVCLLMALLLALTVMLPEWGTKSGLSAAAASVDYPAQLMNLAAKNNGSVLTAQGTADGSAVAMKTLGSDLSCSWRFDRVGAESTGTFFKITNVQSGRLLTPNNYKVSAGSAVILYGSESAKSQHWFVVPVSKDRLGNGLYYKIVNYEDPSLALTQGTSGATLSAYTGADNQLFLLNCDGLQGFAGYCKNDNTGKVKAGNIGGLFGETVEVTTFADLKKYAEADAPYTIIVKGKIDGGSNYKTDGQNHKYNPDGRIYVTDNKTIVGSYGSHVTYNVALCTKQGSGKGNNIIIRNLEMQHDKNSNGNDNIIVYFGAGQNLWVDHVTFVGHDGYNKASDGQPDYDKFLACCYDADYCTVSDCSFGLHEYGLILGYPDSSASNYNKYNGFPRMTIASCKFNKTLTRAPGLMRWGYFHSLNNYVCDFSMAYTVQANTSIFAENCFYENSSNTSGNVCCDWNAPSSTDQNLGYFLDSGSKSSGKVNRLTAGAGTTSNPSYAKVGTWKASSNYDYVSLSADNAKTYCNKYSGAQSANTNWMFLRFAKAGIPSAGYTETPNGSMTPAITPVKFNDGAAFRIKNANSGQYLQVAGAAAENGANAQQWGGDTTVNTHEVWKLYSAGDNYYYLASGVGDGGTFVLDVAGKKTANGTNIDIYQYNGGTNQQFLISDNGDGTYSILTRVTGEASAVEVESASTASGANVQQWELNGASCQNWVFESVTDPGCAMDTSVLYTFENANSGMVMDIVSAKMADGTNVQQWDSNGFDCQKWQLTSFGSGNYYWIRSQENLSFALKAEGSGNGGNIDITPYSTKDSAQLFRFSKNLDGTYSILSHASKDACYVEVDGASKTAGANVQQYGATNSPCQRWKLTTEAIPEPPTEAPTQAPTEAPTDAPTELPENPTGQVPTLPSEEPTVEPIPLPDYSGDVNGDQQIDLLDIITLQKYLHGLFPAANVHPEYADLDQNGEVDVFDLSLLKRLVIAS